MSEELKDSDFINVPISSVPFDVELPYSLHIVVLGKRIVFRSKGDVLNEERLAKLKQQKVQTLYIPKEEFETYVDHLNELMTEDFKESSEVSALQVRDVASGYFREIENRRAIGATYFLKLSEAVERLAIAIGQSKDIAVKLLRRNPDASMYFSSHSLNITIYSIAMGLQMRLKKEELHKLSIAACFCNIGIIECDKEILYKKEKLSEVELSHIRTHPELGFKILMKLLASEEVCLGVRHHGERFDGSGFPRGLKGWQIHPFGRIIAIAEVYSALTSLRPWAEPIAGSEAVELMQGMQGKFDPKMFEYRVQ